MVLIGVLLVLLAAAAGVVLVAGTAQLTDSVQIDVLGGTLSIPPLTLLVTGMVLISLFWLGWVILRSGLRRSRRHRAEAKEAAAAAEAKRAEQERENKRLQDEFAAREQALIQERRLREEAEARAGGSADHPADTMTTTRTADTASTTRTTDAADDRTVVMDDRRAGVDPDAHSHTGGAADAGTNAGTGTGKTTTVHRTDSLDEPPQGTVPASQESDRRS